MSRGRGRLLVLLAGLASGGGCDVAAPPAVEQPAPRPERAPVAPAEEGAVERLAVRVVAAYPHDPGAFTQGLLWHAGRLYESTGQYGRSSLRRVRLETGEVEARVDLPERHFGEGLALVGDQLLQLTWREGVAYRWSLADLARQGEHRYAGEGWGLAFDGERLVMSDGSEVLTFRDPATFEVTGSLAVVREGRGQTYLNELEIVDGAVWANVLSSDEIVRIDPVSGRVTAVVDAGGLLSPAERMGADVLNGIAYRRETGTFLLTGKHWPRLFEVELVPSGQS